MRQIIFSKRAKNELIKLSEYLQLKFSIKVKNEFIDKFEQTIITIKNNPDAFAKSDRNKYHKAVVTKQTSIFYRFDANKINIVAVFDTRQNPNKINKTE